MKTAPSRERGPSKPLLSGIVLGNCSVARVRPSMAADLRPKLWSFAIRFDPVSQPGPDVQFCSCLRLEFARLSARGAQPAI
jgi:hypothetical protein